MTSPAEHDPATADEAELAALRESLVLGDGAAGRTSPNPPVGAVVLDRSGRMVGAGATQPAGGQHAEIVALTQAGVAAAGGTLICTLEPCAHHGRTGPCTDAIQAAGVSRVVFGAADPNAVAAGGAEVLGNRGIEVVGGQLVEQVRRSALGRWLLAIELGRPHVTWKYAATLDGRVAAADGSSRWITSELARADVHRLRASLDAVIVGSGTVLADDPHLTVRDENGGLADRQPIRILFDRRGRIPANARVFDESATTAVCIDAIPEALSAMYEGGVRAVLLEGGPTLAAAFLAAGCVDRVVGYLAPALLGAGPSVIGDLGITSVTQALRLVVEDVTLIGADLRVTAVFPVPATVIEE
ncbi:MAG: bifunctional diaminohydroxyphosphoribosylaminopyrimidine deaminase/5-amino-6-(5-phosphoribosylamino)uracil reductase RibD [Actinomycetota bacterium]|nr:bifunctional diaminohydroxyphosphoribosylaminopyrimidine deaminase/5-amino-6-(5-phosphoribosylamino)uracil reductase RibD [Actinomycetota bacterium]